MIDKAIRTFLGRACGGKLAGLWADDGPTQQAVQYIEQGSPLSHGEEICLRVAFAVWNGRGKATVDDLLAVLDDDNLAAVIELLRRARPGAFR
jgi:hypothetical protein